MEEIEFKREEEDRPPLAGRPNAFSSAISYPIAGDGKRRNTSLFYFIIILRSFETLNLSIQTSLHLPWDWPDLWYAPIFKPPYPFSSLFFFNVIQSQERGRGNWRPLLTNPLGQAASINEWEEGGEDKVMMDHPVGWVNGRKKLGKQIKNKIQNETRI